MIAEFQCTRARGVAGMEIVGVVVMYRSVMSAGTADVWYKIDLIFVLMNTKTQTGQLK